MPLPLYLVTFGIPATCFIEILRGIALRAADFRICTNQSLDSHWVELRFSARVSHDYTNGAA